MPEDEKLVKIRAEIPDADMGGESFWAKPLGNSLYEIRNRVMFTQRLNILDVVRCKEKEGMLPEVVEVVRSSGYKSVGVIFREDNGATEEQYVDAMWELRKKGVTSEKAARLNFAFAIPPETYYMEIIEFLRNQEDKGILYFDELG